MERLYAFSVRLIDETTTQFIRYLYKQINWKSRLIAITGNRGVGKTTLLKQYAKLNCDYANGKVLYVSLDSFWFSNHTLFDLADEFDKNGGTLLLLDEVHKYANWSQEIKNIYDTFPKLHIVFTGSSLLKIYQGEADLSRRATVYHLHGMSFREFLEYEYDIKFPAVTFDEIINNHQELTLEYADHLKILPAFRLYLRTGYYPFYKEDAALYPQRLLATVNTTLETDLPATANIEVVTIRRLKQLLAILAELVPCVPNISKLSRTIETTRPSLLKFLSYLNDANILQLLPKNANGFGKMEKPEKIYLGNTNYAYAFGGDKTDIGSVRETFFLNQLAATQQVCYSPKTDFLVNGKYSFEIGGKNKDTKQIKDLPDSFLALDDVEIGYKRAIPLWLFGFLY